MTTSRIIRHITIAVAAFFPGVGIAGESASYKVPPAFTPLPLGEVKPAGWLKDWCLQAANGITGHSDELDPLFAKGWMDANFKASSTGAQGGDKVVGYAMEQAGYWVDGAVRLARLVDDEKLLAKCHVRFETVLKRVEAGETPVTSKKLWEAGEKWGHWPMAIMGRAMLAEYSHTGDKRYLDAIAKIYADYPKYNAGKKFSLIHHQGRQLANLEVMLEAHRLGGPDSLRTDALTVLAAQNPEIQQRLAWHEQGIARGKVDGHFNSVPFGHAVTVNESMKIPGIGYLYSGDPSWLRFSEAGFEDFEKNEMMPYGLTSAHEHVGGIGPFSASELCNAVDYAWSSTWMLRVTGKSVLRRPHRARGLQRRCQRHFTRFQDPPVFPRQQPHRCEPPRQIPGRRRAGLPAETFPALLHRQSFAAHSGLCHAPLDARCRRRSRGDALWSEPRENLGPQRESGTQNGYRLSIPRQCEGPAPNGKTRGISASLPGARLVHRADAVRQRQGAGARSCMMDLSQSPAPGRPAM